MSDTLSNGLAQISGEMETHQHLKTNHEPPTKTNATVRTSPRSTAKNRRRQPNNLEINESTRRPAVRRASIQPTNQSSQPVFPPSLYFSIVDLVVFLGSFFFCRANQSNGGCFCCWPVSASLDIHYSWARVIKKRQKMESKARVTIATTTSVILSPSFAVGFSCLHIIWCDVGACKRRQFSKSNSNNKNNQLRTLQKLCIFVYNYTNRTELRIPCDVEHEYSNNNKILPQAL